MHKPGCPYFYHTARCNTTHRAMCPYFYHTARCRLVPKRNSTEPSATRPGSSSSTVGASEAFIPCVIS